MDSPSSRKRRKLSPAALANLSPATPTPVEPAPPTTPPDIENPDSDSTDLKLALLASLHPDIDHSTLLDLLIGADGSVAAVSAALGTTSAESPRKRERGVGYQASLLSSFGLRHPAPPETTTTKKAMTRKGQTLHLYTAEDVAAQTPCALIHNFLPRGEAEGLLRELLREAETFQRQRFRLFEREVQSPHRAGFYVGSGEEERRQRTEYVYNGSYLTDVRQLTPHMRAVAPRVRDAVNKAVAARIQSHYPGGVKLQSQSPHEWIPNAAFVNCYDGGADSVGYHTDQLTYLGPRAIIGSLSLGVAREFRVRKIVARDGGEEDAREDRRKMRDEREADAQGQIAIHLPHNSLLVMHAEMQEEWKHSIHPAQAIDPHPIAGSKRINITYRHYRESFHPRYTPRCRCGIATVLRCVQRKKENRGRYMWMCHAGVTPGKEGCTFFQWAEFDDDGEPPWAKKQQPT